MPIGVPKARSLLNRTEDSLFEDCCGSLELGTEGVFCAIWEDLVESNESTSRNFFLSLLSLILLLLLLLLSFSSGGDTASSDLEESSPSRFELFQMEFCVRKSWFLDKINQSGLHKQGNLCLL